jgi:hypothetical protein
MLRLKFIFELLEKYQKIPPYLFKDYHSSKYTIFEIFGTNLHILCGNPAEELILGLSFGRKVRNEQNWVK